MLSGRDDIGIWKSISVGNLGAFLSIVPADAHVVLNPITHNLTIMQGVIGDEDNWTAIAHIDIASGELVTAEQERRRA